jgi:hypothetical protein
VQYLCAAKGEEEKLSGNVLRTDPSFTNAAVVPGTGTVNYSEGREPATNEILSSSHLSPPPFSEYLKAETT